MKVLICLLLLTVFVPLLSAQQPLSPPSRVETPEVERIDYNMRQIASSSSLSETELAGKKLVAQRCSLCHIAPSSVVKARAPELYAETVTRLGEDGVREQIMSGSPRMPSWKYTFQPTDVEKIIAYMKTVKAVRKQASSGSAPRSGADNYMGEQ